jgi:hypothetical protein
MAKNTKYGRYGSKKYYQNIGKKGANARKRKGKK